MSISTLVISDVPHLTLRKGTMAEAGITNSSSGGSTNGASRPAIKLTPATPTGERKLSRSDVELNRCLESENVMEPLLKQYTCAWHKDGSILIQGHMYITANYICFYSNILSWETKLAIKFREVIQIFKQRTALVFPNAISVSTLQHEFFFTSFIHRNHAFKVLQYTWKNSMDGITLSKDDLVSQLKAEKKAKKKGGALVTTDEEENLSTGGSMEDIVATQGVSLSNFRGVNLSASTDSSHQLDNLSKTTDEHSYTDTETDSCLPSHSTASSSGSGLLTGEGEDLVERTGETLKRSLSLVRLNSEEAGVLDEVDSGATPNVGQLDNKSGWSLKNTSYSQLINAVIVALIAVLVFSMLVLICKLSQLDPNLRHWLSWQPWCHFVCSDQQ